MNKQNLGVGNKQGSGRRPDTCTQQTQKSTVKTKKGNQPHAQQKQSLLPVSKTRDKRSTSWRQNPQNITG